MFHEFKECVNQHFEFFVMCSKKIIMINRWQLKMYFNLFICLFTFALICFVLSLKYFQNIFNILWMKEWFMLSLLISLCVFDNFVVFNCEIHHTKFICFNVKSNIYSYSEVNACHDLMWFYFSLHLYFHKSDTLVLHGLLFQSLSMLSQLLPKNDSALVTLLFIHRLYMKKWACHFHKSSRKTQSNERTESKMKINQYLSPISEAKLNIFFFWEIFQCDVCSWSWTLHNISSAAFSFVE